MGSAVRRFAVLALLCAASGAAQAVQIGDPLAIPQPVALPPNLDARAVRDALGAALAKRQWRVDADDGASIRARLPARPRDLRVRVDYAGSLVSFHYLDQNADAHAAHELHLLVNPVTNALLRQLDEEVRMQLELLALAIERPRVVPIAPNLPSL